MIKFIKYRIFNLISDKKFSEILSGSAWSLLARVLAIGMGLVSSVIIARVYGAEVMGIVAVINSFLTLATIFTVMGTNTSILRLIPEHLVKYSPTSSFKLYRKTQYMVIGVSLITGILFFFAANLIADKVFSKPNLSIYFALAAGFIVFRSLMLLNTQAVRGLRLIRVFAFMQVLPSASNLILLVCLTIFFYSKDNPVYTKLISLAITGIMGWIIMGFSFKKRMQPQDLIKPLPARTILAISLPMLMTATMNVVISQIGLIMLGMFRSETEVGYYSVAVKLASLTTFILASINTIAAPKFSELFYSDKIDELFYVAKKSAKLVFWTTTPVLMGLIILGKPLLRIFFGNDFTVAYPALVFLVLGQFLNSISGSTGYFMNMTGKQRIFRNIILMATIINVTLNLFLIPSIGILGAAITAMVSISTWNIITLGYLKRKFGKTTGYFPLVEG